MMKTLVKKDVFESYLEHIESAIISLKQLNQSINRCSDEDLKLKRHRILFHIKQSNLFIHKLNSKESIYIIKKESLKQSYEQIFALKEEISILITASKNSEIVNDLIMNLLYELSHIIDNQNMLLCLYSIPDSLISSLRNEWLSQKIPSEPSYS